MPSAEQTLSPFQKFDPQHLHHYSPDEEDDDDKMSPRPGIATRASDIQASEPLLDDTPERGRTETNYEGTREVDARSRRRHQMRSRSPSDAAAELATKKKYLLAGVFLVLSLVSFVVQTETAVYIQSTLGWKKPYLMLRYLTHGSWVVIWPVQFLVLKLRKPQQPIRTFYNAHIHHIKTTCRMIMVGTVHLTASQHKLNPLPMMFRRIVFITCALTIAGSTWYVAVNMTTPSDLTAIYNCSAFFAYVFSIFLLKERVRTDKVFSVIVACIGVLIVAYGDSGDVEKGKEVEAANRTLGNLVIGVGSVMYGFYEVLYKKAACPPEGVSPMRSVIFSNTIASSLGITTLLVLWIPIPIFHMMGWETFELPRSDAAWLMGISVFANAVFSGSFLSLISLTSPVLSSVAALLTIFLVALTDWMWTGKPLSATALLGGLVISSAFFLLAWSTWREMKEEEQRSVRKKDDDDDQVYSDTDSEEAVGV
ncbi:Similar to Uncharacterized vacuolar membrane protein YML018C; acc. no. Q03730 [Pyronema omphalodes CBS 100304]|uniref:Similar to Uncharacterized vacuolar membrane protein YML018C acc. no. Q03730 n=1 Tax=Pyronema omphalodes (strain CBS 100304) TaxID=1076935 RepID=U4LUS4_PYROM|nr:Similar to Uncharacterized vacuolar membrane protein YML018C; acc. no. Q03730 [Pyronema omphalodes CBS 100304]